VIFTNPGFSPDKNIFINLLKSQQKRMRIAEDVFIWDGNGIFYSSVTLSNHAVFSASAAAAHTMIAAAREKN